MRGADGVRDKVAALLGAEIPRKVPLLRTAWNLNAEQLPELDVITSGEAADLALDTRGRSWIEVINPRLMRITQVDMDPAGRPIYRSRYSARIYIWALGDDWATAIAARDHLAACARLSLLEYPTLRLEGGDSGYLVHVDTIAEEFGEPQRVNRGRGAGGSPRVWCGGVLLYEIDAEETMADGSTRPPLGAVQTTQITQDVYGPGQPFPEESP